MYEKYYSDLLSDDEISKEFMIPAWIECNAVQHEEEIRASMSRLEIENKFFRVKFLQSIDKTFKELFFNYEMSRNLVYNND